MIVGIGTDITKISRIKKLIEKEQGNALQALLTEREIQAKKSASSIAGVFAAKEALLKALGIGFRKGIGRLLEIEILNDTYGKPFVVTCGVVKEIQTEKLINDVTVSISHDADYAIAFVVCQHVLK